MGFLENVNKIFNQFYSRDYVVFRLGTVQYNAVQYYQAACQRHTSTIFSHSQVAFSCLPPGVNLVGSHPSNITSQIWLKANPPTPSHLSVVQVRWRSIPTHLGIKIVIFLPISRRKHTGQVDQKMQFSIQYVLKLIILQFYHRFDQISTMAIPVIFQK